MNLLEALKKIRDDGPVIVDAGICANVIELTCVKEGVIESALSGEIESELDNLLERWPANKGKDLPQKICYPVEGINELYVNDSLMGKLWDNPRRHELLN